MHGDYAYFNQMSEGEPTRDEILAAAAPTIEALGYGDLALRSFLYSGPMSGGRNLHVGRTLPDSEWPQVQNLLLRLFRRLLPIGSIRAVFFHGKL